MDCLVKSARAFASYSLPGLLRSCQITKEQVRLLLFKECDWRGRKILFDSSTIERVPAGKHDKPNRQTDDAPCIVEISNGYAYVYKGPATDAGVLGEMIFGAVAMNYRGLSLKIHVMDDPKRLMYTKVFCVPASRRISRVERKTSDMSSSGDIRNSSKPLSVPVLGEGVALSFSLDRGDSGYCGDQSPYSSVSSTYDYFSMFDIWDENTSQDDIFFHSPPGRKLSTSSNGSWQRRTFQNIATRFELGHRPSSSSNLLSVPTNATNDSQVFSTTSGTNDSLVSSGVNLPQRKSKLGLALLITVSDCAEMDEVRRCVELSPQLQALICRMRLATLAAGTGNNFVSTLHDASTDAARWLTDLLYGPRVQPAWLSLVTSEPRVSTKMADTLLADICSVLSVGDTKHTNFFISTLVTHVLTYHLGWVTTVSPYDTLDPLKQTPPAEARRPYNALWAQLSDLCGSIGFPPRTARTVISGTTNSQFINRLLGVLTYFVRSGDVKRSEFKYEDCPVKETKVINVDPPEIVALKRTDIVNNDISANSLIVPSLNTQSSDNSVSTLVASDVSMKRSVTLGDLGDMRPEVVGDALGGSPRPARALSGLKRNPTCLAPLKFPSDSSLSSTESEPEQKVLFVLGDDEKLVGLKNKSIDGKSVKKSSKLPDEPAEVPAARKEDDPKTEVCSERSCDRSSKSSESPSKCCGQTLQHSKPIKHSGFKFEFDKYPQIVTNYMKSKNLEILDRHYIGKPGNLKLANFQFDPTVVPPIQEERCETCYKCQQMESMLQTPTNASEMEYMNDMPRHSEPQYAQETIVTETDNNHREVTPKTFVRKRKENTIVVNVRRQLESPPRVSVEAPKAEEDIGKEKEKDREREKEQDTAVRVRQVLEFPMPRVSSTTPLSSGFDATLLGGVTDHYVPDLILQGINVQPKVWEAELCRDLELTSYLNKNVDPPMQAVAIVGDTNTWEVRVVGRECGAGGMAPLVGAVLDALPAMRRARVPAHQCLSFLEGKLREFCVLSKTLADMLMSTDFCDIDTLTKSLNIDVNDVPLLLAVATTHTPQVATRYGISYR
ncbi:folliculin-interacting protein 2 isoform X2 [Pectinophora gossypiella]|uniref:folliculin-interacting protein 2 isoform X2 n=1 Tax=Pectinophora gossypiella TaxID=13191 RepID=UPI00214F2A19|nr:folliculin-interacting protein 2 isoform X2 [Pectinophora gossypiella]